MQIQATPLAHQPTHWHKRMLRSEHVHQPFRVTDTTAAMREIRNANPYTGSDRILNEHFPKISYSQCADALLEYLVKSIEDLNLLDSIETVTLRGYGITKISTDRYLIGVSLEPIPVPGDPHNPLLLTSTLLIDSHSGRLVARGTSTGRLLAGCEHEGEAIQRGSYTLLQAGYPEFNRGGEE